MRRNWTTNGRRLIASIAVAMLVSIDVVRPQNGCPGGQGLQRTGNDSFPTCEKCPAGMHSPVGEETCVYCRETLQPTAAQDGCECAPLHFSPWNATAELPDVGCTPCAALHVHRLANARQRSALEELVAADEKADSYAVPCAGPATDVYEELQDKGDVDAVKSLCHANDQVECAGGPKGGADLCPNAGVWILPKPLQEIRQNASALPPKRTSAQVSLFTLQECMRPRGGGPSRCQHWSRCVRDADTRQESADPWTPYVSDEEFAMWLEKGDNSAHTCRTALENIPPAVDPTTGESTRITNFDDPWQRVRTDGLNCCAPNYVGDLCETCIEPLMKIKEHCVHCPGGMYELNWSKAFVGVLLAVGFTLFIMHKATVTFRDADGTTSIAIFFFQLIALLFKDRVSQMAWPFLLDFLAVLELSFLANSERTCVMKLTFYGNYYFSILSTLAVVLITYAVIITVTSLTSTITASHENNRVSSEQAKNIKAAVHVLAHVHVFESLEPQYRERIAEAMDVRDKLKRGAHVLKEGESELFFIVLKGKVDVEHEGNKLSTIRVGQHFGVEALFHKRAASCSISSAADDTIMMCLPFTAFERVSATFNTQAKESMLYNVQHHLHVDEHSDIVQLSGQQGEESRERLSPRNGSPDANSDSPLSDGLLDSSPSSHGNREARTEIMKVVEAEEQAERVLNFQFKQSQRKLELTTEIEVHPCCAPLVTALRPIGLEMGRLYGATLDPTARATGLLECMIALYGPLTLQAMSVLFCRDLPYVDSKTGNRGIRSVLVIDSAEACYGDDYEKARAFAVFCLAVFCLGVPLVMLYAAKVFYMTLTDSTLSRHEAKNLAKTRFHSAWKSMDKQERTEKIEQCAHEIRQQVMGQSSFLLSTFQMCVERRHAYWYPQWHLIRRTFLNYLYFDGLRSGDNTSGLFLIARYDWRVVVSIVLIVSNVLHQYTQPFRDDREDRLETWSLNLLTLVVVVDIADETKSIYVCMVVAIGFALMVARQLWDDLREQKVAESQWHNLRKLQVMTGKVSGDGVESTQVTSMLKIKLAEAEQKNRDDLLKKSVSSFNNPLDVADSDDEEDEGLGSRIASAQRQSTSPKDA